MKRAQRINLPLTLLLCFLCEGAVGRAAAVELPVAVKPSASDVQFEGRWDTTDSAGPRCAYPACGVFVRFTGSAIGANLKDSGGGHGHDRLEVIVDGKPGSVVKLEGGEATVTLAEGLSEGGHTIEVVKRTEAGCGTVQLEALLLPQGGKLLPPPAKRFAHKIEVIGDSISCGYGNEGKNQNEHFSPDTENATETYGFIAARKLDADYACIAWSGKKMWPNNTVGEFYDRTLPADAKSTWDFSKWTPDVVVINLATNDFGGKENPDEAGWTKGYEDFITHLRKHYPKADIYLATGSMMSDAWPPQRKALSTAKSYLDKVVDDLRKNGDEHLHRIDFDPQNMQKNGLGSDWHPSIKTHHLMAEKLVATLEKDLGWKPAL